MNLYNLILMAPSSEGQSGLPTLLMIGAIFVVFYFFMIRPQTKKAKEQKMFREGIKNGDKVITIGGIHGKVTEVKDTSIVIETLGGAKMRVEKSAVSSDGSNILTEEQKPK